MTFWYGKQIALNVSAKKIKK